MKDTIRMPNNQAWLGVVGIALAVVLAMLLIGLVTGCGGASQAPTPAPIVQPEAPADSDTCMQLEATGNVICGQDAKNWCLNFNNSGDPGTETACENIYAHVH